MANTIGSAGPTMAANANLTQETPGPDVAQVTSRRTRRSQPAQQEASESVFETASLNIVAENVAHDIATSVANEVDLQSVDLNGASQGLSEAVGRAHEEGIGTLRSALSFLTKTIGKPIISTAQHFARATQQGPLKDTPIVAILQPALTIDGDIPGAGHKLAGMQVVGIFDPHDRDNVTIQIIARHEVAFGGKANLPSIFSGGASVISGDEIGFEYKVNMDDLRAADQSRPSISEISLFRQAHRRAEGAVQFGQSRVQYSLGHENVDVVKHDLESAGKERLGQIIGAVFAENAIGALPFAATPVIGDTFAHAAALGVKSSVGRSVANAIATPNAFGSFSQNQHGPVDLNGARAQTPWIQPDGYEGPKAGFQVNLYVRFQRNLANNNAIERFELQREEDLNTKIASQNAREGVVNGKLAAEQKLSSQADQSVEASGEVFGILKAKAERLVSDLGQLEKDLETLEAQEAEQYSALDLNNQKKDRLAEGLEKARKPVGDLNADASRRPKNMPEAQKANHAETAAASFPDGDKMQAELHKTRSEIYDLRNSIAEKRLDLAGLNEQIQTLEADAHEFAKMAKYHKDRAAKLETRAGEIASKRDVFAAERQNLIDRGVIPADSHNETHLPHIANPDNPSRMETLGQLKAKRHNKSVSEAMIDENRRLKD